MKTPEFLPGPADRLLLLAPHPDDETLAAGGLLQLAARLGAAVRVLYITRGENNPWAQRVGELRLRIGPGDRIRWGEKRWAEALSALASLGLPDGAAHCLELPDQGLSDLLFRGDASPVDALVEEFARWRPTVVVAPAIWDAHPDHSALGLFFRIALERAGNPMPLVLQYVVHRRSEPDRAGSYRVTLDGRMARSKREAILCHRSQVMLRRGFLLRFVGPEERFTPLEPGAVEVPPHSVRLSQVADGVVGIEIARPLPPGLGRPVLAIVRPDPVGAGSPAPDGDTPPCVTAAPWTALRVELDLPARRGRVWPEGDGPGRRGEDRGTLPLEVDSRRVRLDLPLPLSGPADPPPAVYVNVIRPAMRRIGFFDAAGWRIVRAPGRAPDAPGRKPRESVPGKDDARKGANSLAGVVAAQGFEPRTKGL
jgi:LmbE family N-acetylglucosaminyl deacetylase